MTTSTRFLPLVTAVLVAAAAGAAEPKADNPAAPPAEKPAELWKQDYKAALEEARKTKRPVLVDFTGSDWCGWCIKLKKEVFDQQAFQDYATENLVLVELDFPKNKALDAKLKKQNAELLKKFRVEGFPTVLLVNATGKEIARTGYQEGGPEKYVEHLKKLLLQAAPPVKAAAPPAK